MTILKIPTLGDMPPEIGQPVPVSVSRLVCIEQSPEFVQLDLVPEKENGQRHRRAYQFYRDDLVKLAKEILRELEPTPEQEMLATLRRIETLLKPAPDAMG